MSKPKPIIPNQNNNRNQLSAIVSQSIHSGPLPDAETLQKYNSIVPGAAERILKMAEKEQEARIETNKTGMNNVLKIEQEKIAVLKRGQAFALIISVFVIALGGYLAYLGATSAAAWVVGTALVGSILAFVAGKNKKEDKAE